MSSKIVMGPKSATCMLTEFTHGMGLALVIKAKNNWHDGGWLRNCHLFWFSTHNLVCLTGKMTAPRSECRQNYEVRLRSAIPKVRYSEHTRLS